MTILTFMLSVDVFLIVLVVLSFILTWLSTYIDHLGFKMLRVIFAFSGVAFVVWSLVSVAVAVVIRAFNYLGVWDVPFY